VLPGREIAHGQAIFTRFTLYVRNVYNKSISVPYTLFHES